MSLQYFVLKTVSRIICLFPYSIILGMGKVLGHIYYHAAAKQRRRALAQIQESLGLSGAAAERIIRSLFVKLGRTFLEVMYTPALNKENIERYIEIENAQYLTDAVAQGRGVVFLTAHIGNWEWLGARLAMAGYPMASVIKRQPNDQHTRILNEYRRMTGIEIFARGTTEIVGAAKALKNGKVLGFLADQDGGHDGIFVEFLGKMASTPQGPAVFARKFKCPIIPTFIVRRPEGGHKIIVHPPVEWQEYDTEDRTIYELTKTLTLLTENFIRQYPDEWLWFQKRWNTKYQGPAADKNAPAGKDSRVGEAV
ncbi:MAG: lysophospholipid acyltransferase family protein [Negativicutes bacterium]|nr:lysophospholipid acyltransferase family protein [Negativicutes bacterium]